MKNRTAKTVYVTPFRNNFFTCQNVTCAIFVIACKMCFTTISIYLTMNSELCLNCLPSSGVGGEVRLLVSMDSWPKASLCKDGMKKL